MTDRASRWVFGLFVVSGFCSLTYQVLWLRLCMAQFGVTTAMVSIVLSVFMAGLALGSLLAGALARRWEATAGLRVSLSLYAAAETAIACSGKLVPWLLSGGRHMLAASAADAFWGSAAYYAASGGWVVVALLPFCACMGATFPLGMWVMRQTSPSTARRSFSYLYLANVLGAASGALASAFVLIERLGFRGTLSVAAALNVLLGLSALALAFTLPREMNPSGAEDRELAGPAVKRGGGSGPLWALLATGLASLAMEVVWVRLFTPYLGNLVYAFSILLTTYLLATSLGSAAYRRWSKRSVEPMAVLGWSMLAVAGLIPLITADPRLPLVSGLKWGTVRVLAGIAPFCAILGFLSPMLVDRWSAGDPHRAGQAYAVNVFGCIVGPLLAGFLLIPALGERWTLVVLAAPLALVATRAEKSPARRRWVHVAAAAAVSILVLFATRGYESLFLGEVRRDSTATVIATGAGMERRLLVNGVGMTILTPVTKTMAHLPLAFLEGSPRSGLTICFGMGTTFRSVSSWGITSTVVELVPSVPVLFSFFHADARRVVSRPGARIVIDDGRRFLERSPETFDVVVVDPAPPIESAGSSLLYSVEFYEVVKRRLEPGGIVQAWIPGGEVTVVSSMVKAIQEVFPHVRAFTSVEGWGIHLLASERPLPRRSPDELVSRLPADAVRDLEEWRPPTARDHFATLLAREVAPADIVARAPLAPVLRDDRPINEYFLVRRMLERWRGTRASGSGP